MWSAVPVPERFGIGQKINNNQSESERARTEKKHNSPRNQGGWAQRHPWSEQLIRRSLIGMSSAVPLAATETSWEFVEAVTLPRPPTLIVHDWQRGALSSIANRTRLLVSGCLRRCNQQRSRKQSRCNSWIHPAELGGWRALAQAGTEALVVVPRQKFWASSSAATRECTPADATIKA